MKDNARAGADVDEELARFFSAVAEDLEALALLHHAEPTGALLADLKAAGFPGDLALRCSSRAAVEVMEGALSEMPTAVGAATLNQLAADYAAIYLTYALAASPCESVWLDEEHLACQKPMFAVREWYGRHGLVVENWRIRSDDHLVLQLLFIAHLLKKGAGQDAAAFMDAHLLRWLPNFSQRVAARCDTQFFAGLAILTGAYCEELRALLAGLLECPRALPEEDAAPEPVAESGGAYVPGQAPSW